MGNLDVLLQAAEQSRSSALSGLYMEIGQLAIDERNARSVGRHVQRHEHEPDQFLHSNLSISQPESDPNSIDDHFQHSDDQRLPMEIRPVPVLSHSLLDDQ